MDALLLQNPLLMKWNNYPESNYSMKSKKNFLRIFVARQQVILFNYPCRFSIHLIAS